MVSINKEKNIKNYFDDIVNFIRDKFPESLFNIVIIICIAYIISKIISIFNIHINYTF